MYNEHLTRLFCVRKGFQISNSYPIRNAIICGTSDGFEGFFKFWETDLGWISDWKGGDDVLFWLSDDLLTAVAHIFTDLDGWVYGIPDTTDRIVKYDPIDDITSFFGEETDSNYFAMELVLWGEMGVYLYRQTRRSSNEDKYKQWFPLRCRA